MAINGVTTLNDDMYVCKLMVCVCVCRQLSLFTPLLKPPVLDCHWMKRLQLKKLSHLKVDFVDCG